MMNLKYYLRGLGIGIIVTALIMGLRAGGKESLSNAEIKERAKALGMVEEESMLLKDMAPAEQGTPEETPSPSLEPAEAEVPSAAPEEKQEVSTPENTEDVLAITPKPDEAGNENPGGALEGEISDIEESVEEPTAKPTSAPEKTPEPEEETKVPEEGSITIQIANGEGSLTVCKKLVTAGLIENASDYDLFLYQNGYDKKIRAGTFQIPAGASEETVARIICGME